MCKVSQPGNGTDLPEQGLGREKPSSDQLCCYQGLFAGEREVLIVLTQTPSAANLALTPHTGLGRIGPVAPRPTLLQALVFAFNHINSCFLLPTRWGSKRPTKQPHPRKAPLSWFPRLQSNSN